MPDQNKSNSALATMKTQYQKPSGVSLLRGIKIIKLNQTNMPNTPGVYRMLDHEDRVLYVGKAKRLRKRVQNYTNPKSLTNRIQRMVASTARLEIITTESEVEALLLESNLIKTLKPKYNIVFKDDKSFPYILITDFQDWPRIIKYRGTRSGKGRYFGPFASAGAVNQTLNALHKAFPLRSCPDSIFKNRTRPCLEYQIKRCSAPCVGRISSKDYNTLVEEASSFLRGQSQIIQKRLSDRMISASQNLEFETAAAYRDRIQALNQIQSRQNSNLGELDEADVIAIAQQAGQSCVQTFFYRGGQSYGNRAYFPSHPKDAKSGEVLHAFISQFYTNKIAPNMLLISENLIDSELLIKALSSKTKLKVKLQKPVRGSKRRLIDNAKRNAEEALSRHLAETASHQKLLKSLALLLNMESMPARIEVYDNSHISGQNAVGGMIVVGKHGFEKPSYRRYNIRSDKFELAEGGINAGDDYGMLREVLNRRFGKLVKNDPLMKLDNWPDLCIIDGGAGQLSTAQKTIKKLGISGIKIMSVAKGPNRNAGREILYLDQKTKITLEPRDPLLYFIQRVRDEAHRFAISSYRSSHRKENKSSVLDDIPGIGSSRKRALLHHFGSARSISQAGLKDLERVQGISKKIALSIYNYLNHLE